MGGLVMPGATFASRAAIKAARTCAAIGAHFEPAGTLSIVELCTLLAYIDTNENAHVSAL